MKPKRLLLAARGETSPVAFSWYAGSPLARIAGRFDGYWQPTSWEQALAWVCANSETHGLGELHIWGHGAPGAPLIGGEALPFGSRIRLHRDLFADLRRMCSPSTLIWFRSCAVFHGAAGKDFAERLSCALSCRVAGHTYNIGALHSGLHSLRSGEMATWPDHEGCDDDGGVAWSHMRAPHTVPFFWDRVPEGW